LNNNRGNRFESRYFASLFQLIVFEVFHKMLPGVVQSCVWDKLWFFIFLW